jgi:ribosome modulation factor
MHVAPYRNKAHRSAFADGWLAARNGEPRSAPYGADCRTSLYFRRAWLAGFDSAVPAVCGARA